MILRARFSQNSIGTQVGDPIEFDSIRKTFQGPDRKQILYVGSVKDNIGHTETSSGVAGLLKTVLMMQKHRIPKQANFVRLNPKIPALDDKISIPNKTIEWSAADDLSSNAVAMVTNYGAAGSNAALVVKQHKVSSGPSELHSLSPYEVPIILAANSAESLGSYCKVLLSNLRAAPLKTCADLAYNLAIKQNRALDYVSTFTIPSNRPDALKSKLMSISGDTAILKKQSARRLPVILCFGGQNGNEANISEDLFNQSGLLKHHLVSTMDLYVLWLSSLRLMIANRQPLIYLDGM